MTTNTLLTPSIITKESLVILENMLTASKHVRRDFEDSFGSAAKYSFKIGDTLNIRKPNRFTVRTGAPLQPQDVTETSVPLVVDTQIGVDFTFSSVELTLDIERFSERYLVPAMATLANKIDYDVLQLYKQVWNNVGTPGSVPSTFAALAAVTRKMNELAVPSNDRNGHLSPYAEVSLADAFKQFFNPQGAISDAYEKGQIGGPVAGLQWFMDQNVARHTTGTVSNTTPAIDTNVVNGDTTFHMDGLNGATVTANKGDVFTIAGIYSVNPQNRQSTGQLAQFVVTATTAAVGSEFAALPIAPAPYSSGPFQNVTALPVDGDLVTFLDPSAGTSVVDLAWQKDAFALACVPLEMPKGVDFSARESYKGISMRIVRQYDISDDIFPCRIDILYGTKAIYPELAVRLSGER